MSLHSVVADPNTHAAAITASGAAGTAVFWGLKLSDLGIIVASVVAVLGLFIQVLVYFETRRHNRAREELRDTADE